MLILGAQAPVILPVRVSLGNNTTIPIIQPMKLILRQSARRFLLQLHYQPLHVRPSIIHTIPTQPHIRLVKPHNKLTEKKLK